MSLTQERNRPLLSLLALLLPLVALTLQWLLWDLIVPYAWFLFYPAVFLSSWLGGRAIGLWTTAISVTIVWWFFVPPEYAFVKQPPVSPLPALVFIVMGVLFSVFHSQLRLANRQLAKALDDVCSANERTQRLYEETRQARDRISASEARYRSLFDQAADGIFIADLDGRYTDVNTAGCRMLGREREEIVGKTILDLIPAEDVARLWESKQHMEQGDTHVAEWRLRCKDGSYLPVEVSAKILPDGRWQGFVRDISERKRAEAALQEREERLELALRGADLATWDWNMQTGEVIFNARWAEMRGYRPEEIRPHVDSWISGMHPDDLPRVQKILDDYLAGTIPEYQAEFRVATKSGDWIWILDQGKVFARDAAGQPVRMAGTELDITVRMQAEAQLRQAATVFDNTVEAIMVTDAYGNVVAINPAYTKITGFTLEDLLGRNPRLQQSGLHDKAFYQSLWSSLEETGHWQGEIWNRRKNGEAYPAWENISEVRDDRGRLTHYVSMLSDISSLKQAEARLSHLAHHDPLTNLPNRLAFSANLEQTLERATRHGSKVALLFLDLDRFKLINDTLGHATGDRLLQVIAERLRHNVRAEDVAARLGGDEFTLILEDIHHPEDAAVLAQKIIRAVAEPVRVNEHEVATSASIGISIYPDDATNVGDLAKAADAAMYRAKSRGRNTYEFYTSDLTQHALQRLSLETQLRQALLRKEFRVHYQPQVELASGRVCGLEALLRWQHPELGLVLPEHFIDVAEDSGLIDAIGDWVLQEAVAQARSWLDTGVPPVRIAVNLSGRQIIYDHTVDLVRRVLHDHGFPPDGACLELEITERTLYSGESSLNTLRQLRNIGVSLAIDDFGTGYSSLSQLKHMPIDTLKIDQAFLRNVPQDADNAAITRAIISMGHSLGLKVIAEGVETPAQLAFLRSQGCDEMQGFLISKARDAESIAEFLMGGMPSMDKANRPATE